MPTPVGLHNITHFRPTSQQLATVMLGALVGRPVLDRVTAIVLHVFRKALADYGMRLPNLSFDFGGRWNEGFRYRIGRLALKLPAVRNEYSKEYRKFLTQFTQETSERWTKLETFLKRSGTVIPNEMPAEGMSYSQLIAFVLALHQYTNVPLKDTIESGNIYNEEFKTPLDKTRPEKNLPSLLGWAATFCLHWNMLHDSEFPAGSWLTHKITQWVGQLYGANPDEIMGVVTGGGSLSLMNAARSYVNWGMDVKGHKPGQSVIIAPESVHASLTKDQTRDKFQWISIPVDEKGNFEISELQKLLAYHGSDVVAVFGSAPSYPTGAMDPIKEMGQLAKQYGVGMHVDGCLGAFAHWQPYLSWEGVTSMSADLHKIAGTPKGSSLLMTRPMPESENKNLFNWSVYPSPGWMGGLYGSPGDEGSRPVVNHLWAFLTLASRGRNFLEEQAKQIQKKAKELEKTISGIDGLKMVRPTDMHVVAFKVDGIGFGATYGFVKLMKKHGLELNEIRGDIAHFCITGAVARNPGFIRRFQFTAQTCIDQLRQQVREGKKFSGSASLYGEIGAAIHPTLKKGWGALFENYLLGRIAADDAVRAFFLARNNPRVYRHLLEKTKKAK